MTEITDFDTVVVGAGIEGSATAYHLAKQGKKTLLLEQKEFVKYGGEIRDNEPVESVVPVGDKVRIQSSERSYLANAVVLCLGPWAGKFLKSCLGLSLPLQFCSHDGVEADPDSRDSVSTEKILTSLKEYVKQHLPGVEPEPKVVETCIYTVTPDDNFILDRHPSHKNVIIGAGFSGHGFKLGPIVGKILSELALNEKTSYQMNLFRIDRFQNSVTKQKSLL